MRWRQQPHAGHSGDEPAADERLDETFADRHPRARLLQRVSDDSLKLKAQLAQHVVGIDGSNGDLYGCKRSSGEIREHDLTALLARSGHRPAGRATTRRRGASAAAPRRTT